MNPPTVCWSGACATEVLVSHALQTQCPGCLGSWRGLCVLVAPALAGAGYSVGSVVRVAGCSLPAL